MKFGRSKVFSELPLWTSMITTTASTTTAIKAMVTTQTRTTRIAGSEVWCAHTPAQVRFFIRRVTPSLARNDHFLFEEYASPIQHFFKSSSLRRETQTFAFVGPWIKFSVEGRASILKGVDVLANAVSVPKGILHVRVRLLLTEISVGCNVIIEQSFGGPKITKGLIPLTLLSG
jgi:hypothetical protein